MSIDLRISDKPFIADILFKDGTRRRIDYAARQVNGNFFAFFADKDGGGAVVLINADMVVSLEIDSATQTVGAGQ